MFLGSYEATMDAKGRFTFPGGLRDKMPNAAQEKITVTSDPMSDCLLVYSADEWAVVLERILALPNSDRVVHAFGQKIMGDAQELEFDGNGRLVIPPFLRKSAQMERKLIVRGVGKKIELWSERLHGVAEQERTALLRDPSSRPYLQDLSY